MVILPLPLPQGTMMNYLHCEASVARLQKPLLIALCPVKLACRLYAVMERITWNLASHVGCYMLYDRKRPDQYVRDTKTIL